MDAAIFGIIVADVLASPLNAHTPPAHGDLVFLDHIHLTAGGNVPNTGAAMAKLGMDVAAAGLVGNDAFGSSVLKLLEQSHLDTSHVFPDPRAQTAATVVAVAADGNRRFFHVPGVNELIDESNFRRCFPLFARCSIVHIGYLGLLPGLTGALPGLLEELKTNHPNTKISLDTVNPPGQAADLWPILPHLDIFCPSRPEAAMLTGESDPKKMIAGFRERMPSGLIGIKLDTEGCILDDSMTQATAPIYPVKVVDTTGAGDTWYAGLLTALLKQMPLDQTANFANRVAADCCTALGGSAGVQSCDSTLSRL